MENVVVAKYNGVRFPDTAPKYQFDYGQTLQFENIELPQAFEVHFSNNMSGGDSITAVASGGVVSIPDDMFQSGDDIFAFIFVPGEDAGETVYRIHIPVAKRPNITELTPTPTEQSAIDEAISALNDAVTLAEGYAGDARASADEIENITVTAETLPSGSDATADYEDGVMHFGIPKGSKGDTGESGFSPTITVIDISGGHRVTITDSQGMESFDVFDGHDGQNGADGYSPTIAVSNISGGHRLTITDKNGTRTVDVMDGEQGQTGATGNGIASIMKTGTVGLVDTYTITFTDGNSTTFTVTNGQDGTSDFAEYLPIDSASGSIASFSDGAKDIPVESLKVNINPVQDLNGQSNPYPAGGGKNKFSSDIGTYGIWIGSSGSESTYAQGYVTNAIRITPSTSYVASVSGTTLQSIFFAWYDSSDGFISRDIAYPNLLPYVMTSPNNATFVRIGVSQSSGTITKSDVDAFKVQFEQGATATAWSPYENICPIIGHTQADVVVAPTSDPDDPDKTTHNIPFGQTVYGGSLEVETGVLTVTHALVDMGDLSWTYDTTSLSVPVFYANIINRLNGSTDMLCTTYKCIDGNRNVLVDNDKAVASWNTTTSQMVAVRDSAYSDAQAFTTSVTDQKLVYLLATPQTVQLTEVEVKTILGQNNIYSNCNGTVEVVYRADIQGYIDKKISALASLI